MKLKKIVINTSLLILFFAIFSSCKKSFLDREPLCIIADQRINKDS